MLTTFPVLTLQEKDLMLEMLSAPATLPQQAGQPIQRIGVVSIAKLIEYRSKDNDVIRAELVVYSDKKKKMLQDALIKAQKQVADINAQLS